MALVFNTLSWDDKEEGARDDKKEKRKRGMLLRGSLFSVIWLGLEPKTYCLEGSCSIQLSYQTHFNSGF